MIAALLAAALVVVPPPSEIGTLVAERFLSGYRAEYKKSYVHYAAVSYWVNALELARATGNTNLESRLVARFRALPADRFKDWRHVDLAVQGALWLEVAILTHDEAALEKGLWYADTQWAEPTADEPLSPFNTVGNQPFAKRLDWWRRGYSSQTRLWIDDMYMITLLQTQAYRATGKTVYLDRAEKEMLKYLEVLPRPDGLFNHADYAPYVWARGDGWMAASMAMILSYRDNAVIRAQYEKMMAALLKWQRPDGLWGQLVNDPESWDETSGSAMFAYAMAMGVRHGWLVGSRVPRDRSPYADAVSRAWSALCARLDAKGDLEGICIGTGATNSREFYLKRPTCRGDCHGQAPLLWLALALM